MLQKGVFEGKFHKKVSCFGKHWHVLEERTTCDVFFFTPKVVTGDVIFLHPPQSVLL